MTLVTIKVIHLFQVQFFIDLQQLTRSCFNKILQFLIRGAVMASTAWP